MKANRAHHRCGRLRLLVSLIVLAIPLRADTIHPLTNQWTSGTGDWSNATNWSLATVPSNQGSNWFHVVIAGEDSDVRLAQQVNIETLTLVDSRLMLGADLVIRGGRIDNRGTILMNDGLSGGRLYLEGSTVFGDPSPDSRRGQLLLTPKAEVHLIPHWPEIPGNLVPLALTNTIGHEISGVGLLDGQASTNTVLVNLGTLLAFQPAAEVRQILDLRFRKIVNRGSLQAALKGYLSFDGHEIDNTNGLILGAYSQGQPGLRFGSTGLPMKVNGGSIRARQGGFILCDPKPFVGEVAFFGCELESDETSSIEVQNSVRLHDVTLRSPLHFGTPTQGVVVTLSGVIQNDALQVLGALGSHVWLAGNTTLAGGGTLGLTDPWKINVASLGVARALTNDVGHTIAGGGFLGNVTDQVLLVNHGTILSDQHFGAGGDVPLVLLTGTSYAVDGGSNAVNSGELRAIGGASLEIRQVGRSVLQNAGVIRATGFLGTNGSRIVVNGRVHGPGTWRAENQGRIILQPSATITGPGAMELAGGALELHGQTIPGQIRGDAASLLDVQEEGNFVETLDFQGVARISPHAELVVNELIGGGTFFDASKWDETSFNLVRVNRRLAPGPRDRSAAQAMVFDHLSLENGAALELDVLGPDSSMRDTVVVRSTFAADGGPLRINFADEPRTNEVFTVVRRDVVPNNHHAAPFFHGFGNVIPITPALGLYHDGSYVGDLHIGTNEIYLTNVRRATVLPLLGIQQQGAGSSLVRMEMATEPGKRTKWQRSFTLQPGSWEDYSPVQIAAGTRAKLFIDTTEARHAFFRAIELPVICPTWPAGQLHWWRGESDGLDSKGTNHATLVGGVSFDSGRSGLGFHLDGVDGSLGIGAGRLPLPSADSGWTLGLWVWREATSDGSAALLVDSGYALKLEQFGSPTHNVGFTQFGRTDYSFNYSAPLHEWTHLSFVGESMATHLYVNGQWQDRIGVAIPLPLQQLGGNPGDRLKAIVDEVMVFNRPLGPDEIRTLYYGTQAQGIQCAP